MTLFGPETAADEPDEATAVKWSELTRTTRQRCDECVETALRYRGREIGRARWRRRQGGRERLFCAEHAHDARLNDDNERRP